MSRVVCVGGAVVDLKFRLRADAVARTSNPAAGGTAFGGVARNVAENLAALGLPVALVSRVGADPAGAALRAHLVAAGVDVTHLGEDPALATAHYVAVLDPVGDLVIGIAAMDVLDGIGAADLDRAWPVHAPGWVFCDANLPARVLAHAVHRARAGDVPLVLDAVSAPKATRLPTDLCGVRLVSLNVDEARAYLRGHDGDDVALARRVQARGADVALLTLGARGLLLAGPDGVTALPAAPADPVDVTGAGDALIAGTVAALAAGTDLIAAVTEGAERAARTVESPLSVLPRLRS